MKPTWTELIFYHTDGRNEGLFESPDPTKASYVNLYINKRHPDLSGKDIRRRMNQELPKEKIVGKVRVWNNRWEIRIGCEDWETAKLIVEFLKGL